MALTWLLAASPARGASRFVAVGGSDAGNDCFSSASPCATIAHAIAQAGSGDTIAVATGTYGENVLLDASTVLSIEGGWTADFTARDPVANPTTVDGHNLGRVFDVAAGAGETIDITLDGLMITRGEYVAGAGVNAETSADGVITLTVRGCVLHRNRASFGPGLAVFANAPGSVQLSVSDSSVRNNRGGGIGLFGVVDALVEDSTLERNRLGSAFSSYTAGTSVTIDRCTIDRNMTPGPGGGIGAEFYFGGTSTFTLTNSRITRNRAAGGAGAWIGSGFGSATVEVTNCVFYANRAPRTRGGGLDAFASLGTTIDLALTSSTLVHNPGGGLSVRTYDSGIATAAVTDTILWRNGVQTDADLLLEEGGGPLSVDADHDVVGIRTGTGTFNDLGGNLAVDPLLVRRTDPHLTPASPAIDAGTCAGAPALDFEGDPRPSGLGCDIGADELVP